MTWKEATFAGVTGVSMAAGAMWYVTSSAQQADVIPAPVTVERLDPVANQVKSLEDRMSRIDALCADLGIKVFKLESRVPEDFEVWRQQHQAEHDEAIRIIYKR